MWKPLPLLSPPQVTVLNFKPLNLSVTLQRINSAIESYATGTTCLILLLPLPPLFTSRKHFALHISKRHWLSTDTINWHCYRFTYFSIVMLSVLISHHTIADAMVWCEIYCDQYCTATLYSATYSARGTHIMYVFPNKQSNNFAIHSMCTAYSLDGSNWPWSI